MATKEASGRACPLQLNRTRPTSLAEEAGQGRSWIARATLVTVGWLCVVLGVVGAFLPLVPTTCFLLAAGWCFARSAPRFRHWLYANPVFGHFLTAYARHGTIPRRLKVGSLLFLWVSIVASLLVARPPDWWPAAFVAVGLSVSVHLMRLGEDRGSGTGRS